MQFITHTRFSQEKEVIIATNELYLYDHCTRWAFLIKTTKTCHMETFSTQDSNNFSCAEKRKKIPQSLVK